MQDEEILLFRVSFSPTFRLGFKLGEIEIKKRQMFLFYVIPIVVNKVIDIFFSRKNPHVVQSI